MMGTLENTKKYALAAFASMVLLMSATATASSETQQWESDLRKQLLTEENCELNYLTDSRTFELLGKQTVKARAHCMDKRAYDVTRSGDESAFKIESCAVVTC